MKTALIISSDARSRKELKVILESHYQVIEFEIPQIALVFITHSPVDLVIVEDSISVVQFRTLFHATNRMSPGIPVIVSTSRQSVETVVKYMKMGVREVIFQPYHANLVLKTLRGVLCAQADKEKKHAARKHLAGWGNQNLNPHYIYKMNLKKYMQSVVTELKGRVLNAEITYDEALVIYEDKIRRIQTL